jgi:sugar lactone lactonase YvrE
MPSSRLPARLRRIALALTAACGAALFPPSRAAAPSPGDFVVLAGMTGIREIRDGKGTTARLRGPGALAFDAADNLYFLDDQGRLLRRITPDGTVATIARLPTYDGSMPTSYPDGVAVDRAGNVYVSRPKAGVILRVSPAGMVSVYAGQPGVAKRRDGRVEQALFYSPAGLAFDRAGNLFVADAGDDVIRRISADGSVTTVAGGREGRPLDGPASRARFASPWGLAFDAAGNLDIAECTTTDDEGRAEIACAIRQLNARGKVTTLAADSWYTGAFHPKTTAGGDLQFTTEAGIAVDPDGSIMFPDAGWINSIGAPEAGPADSESIQSAEDMEGPKPTWPAGIAVDSHGNVFVSDEVLDYIVRYGNKGARSVFAGRANIDEVGAAGQQMVDDMHIPAHASVDPQGRVFVLTTGREIREVLANGDFGKPLNHDVHAATWRFAVAGDHSLFLQADFPNDCTVSHVAADGHVGTFAVGRNCTLDFANDRAGNVFVYESDASIPPSATSHVDRIERIGADGRRTPIATIEMPDYPAEPSNPRSSSDRHRQETAFAIGDGGDIYVADGRTIRRIDTKGTVTRVAGSEFAGGHVDGAADRARFDGIDSLAVDPSGTIRVGEWRNNDIREISRDGTVRTLAGAKGEGRLRFDPAVVGPVVRIRGIAQLPDGHLVVLNNNTVLRTN